tara:strand:- start:299 stop:517 length:219 start_codon:yes stop_codon:yes gene_type:complete
MLRLRFIAQQVLQPKYAANKAQKGINARATSIGMIDLGRANVDFSNHPDLLDASAFQRYFGCIGISPPIKVI